LLYSPVPSPIDRIKNKHRWRMIIKCKYDDRVRELLNGMNVEFYGFKNNSTRVAIEVNPNNML
jgi:primosomal protein N' (replication factor Y)